MSILKSLVFALSVAVASAQTAIDFSHAGYGGGGVPIPSIPAVLSVSPTGGDDTKMLQLAIDDVSLHAGYRNALLLRPGRYRVAGKLRMDGGGVVLRGLGDAT